MRTGRAIVSLDNLNGELAGDLLCQVVTQPVVSYRPLGSSAEERITSRSVYTANANNITIVDDLSRRTLLRSPADHPPSPAKSMAQTLLLRLQMTSTTRSINALIQIMHDEAVPPRRRVEAAEQLLDYECPAQIVEEAKAFLTSIFEDSEMLVDIKLDALKLMRKAEAKKIVPARVSTRDQASRIEICRALEIARRRRALIEAGVFPFPPGCDDDLTGSDCVPMPTPDDDAESPKDLAEVLRNARPAHLRKIDAKGS